MRFNVQPLNRVVAIAVLSTAIFLGLAYVFPMPHLLVLLNGVFAGTMAAVTVAYWRLLWNAVLGIRPYDRVRQMTLGFALCWAAYIISVLSSIYFQSTGLDINSSLFIAGSRYLAIIAAVLQVTAPDFGLGLFHGRDRKVLATGVVVGIIVAFVVVFAQADNLLAEELSRAFRVITS